MAQAVGGRPIWAFVIWQASQALSNAQVCDPYWRVQSPVIHGGGAEWLDWGGLAVDESAIRIAESALATNTGDPIEPTCQHGILSAAYVLALLPQFHLSGEVPLQGQSQRDGVSVQLSQGEMYQIGPYDAVSQYQSGNNFDFSDVVSDSYTITTAQPRNLNVSVF